MHKHLFDDYMEACSIFALDENEKKRNRNEEMETKQFSESPGNRMRGGALKNIRGSQSFAMDLFPFRKNACILCESLSMFIFVKDRLSVVI